MVETLKCISPIDQSVCVERTCSSLEDARQVVKAAQKAQIEWQARTLEERISMVLAAVDKLADYDDEIVKELAVMMGRPVRFGGEYAGVKSRSVYMAGIAKDALADQIIDLDDGADRKIKRVPLGTLLVVAPWNYPYLTAINTIVPGLIAGNTVVLKHASQTLLVGERFQQAFDAAGIPAGVFQNVFLDHDTTSTLIAEGAFNLVNFTGSVGGGRAMEKAAAGTFTAIGLELGGKDPGYITQNADLDAAVASLVDGAMFNSGQCCCGIERIYVHESRYDEAVEKIVDLVKQYQLGNPLDEATTLGPMAHERFAHEVREQITDALETGATAHIDTFPEDDGKTYLSPQVLTDVTHDMRIMQEESFGPVVGIMKVRDDQEAITLMNDSEFGLTCSVWTNDMKQAEAIGDQLETGTVLINRADHVDPALCWTGSKDTGRGGALSAIGFQNLTRPKSYYLKKV
ncbi:aldehyde dehydrogenase family protein [Polycladidibacter stylochi]|uniref:aldehyde dehydrogenase family protein n=1 Tax=Polycladidibacter stylochi TaxID=1807766 RepID=UPI0008320572|nr:aldehyde dehydrogenase family protein [Pseudovibrio stylochi]